MNKIAVLSLCLMLFGVFAPSAYASSIETRFKELDRNRDGAISKSEAAQEPALWSRFSSYDQDKDGKLSLREFANYARQ